MEFERILSVSQLNEYVFTLFTFDPLFKNVWVAGEISNLSRNFSGHMYFTLKDEGALVRCVMFRQNASQLSFRPENGMQVVARGSVSLYRKEGQYQYYVTELRPEGQGAKYLQLERLKEKLKGKGYFDEARKRPLPILPKRIGVATSPTGAVIRDIINVTHRRFPGMEILLYPVSVQGRTAAAETAEAIRRFNELGETDVIIIARGGGSAEDLWEFNSEELADAIFASRIPVVSAIGHETDYTIADLVADMRAPTPSAAAELCVPVKAELEAYISGLKAKLEREMRFYISQARARVGALQKSAALFEPTFRLQQNAKRLNAAKRLLCLHMRRVISEAKERVCRANAGLYVLGPAAVLNRGYAIVRAGGCVMSAKTLAPGQRVEIAFADGGAEADIVEVNAKKTVTGE